MCPTGPPSPRPWRATRAPRRWPSARPNGHATPNTPGWAAVEAENPVKDYMTAVLTGGDAAKEAAKASEDITRAMNAGS